MEQIYNETIFLLSETPKDNTLHTIVIIHAINLHSGLKLIGLKEEDPVQELHGLPEGWNQSDVGIFSFKYQSSDSNSNSKIFQFKVIQHNESTWVNVFGVQIDDPDKMLSYQVDTSKLNFKSFRECAETLKPYERALLTFLKPKEKVVQSQMIDERQPQPQPQRPQGLFWNQPRNDPLDISNYGRSDLNPHGTGPMGIGIGGSGGNLMGPGFFNGFGRQQQQQQQFPDLRVPPGARFDPFGPDPNFQGGFNVFDGPGRRNNNFPF